MTEAGSHTRSETGTFISEREPGEALDRESVIRMMSDALRILHRRSSASRFMPRKNDKEHLAMIRVLVQAAIAYNAIARDSDIDDLIQRIAAVEERKP